MVILPLLADSRPAIRRNVVDLPQPDGPSSATRWPAGAEKLTFSTAAAAPQFFVTPARRTSAMGLFNRCAGDLTRFFSWRSLGVDHRNRPGALARRVGAAIRPYFARRMLRHGIALMTTR